MHYDTIKKSEGIYLARSYNSKECRFVTTAFLIMGLNIKILFVMTDRICWWNALLLVILLLSLLTVLIIIALFMAFANLKQLIYYEILCLMIVGICKTQAKDIDIENRMYSYYFHTKNNWKLNINSKKIRN